MIFLHVWRDVCRFRSGNRECDTMIQSLSTVFSRCGVSNWEFFGEEFIQWVGIIWEYGIPKGRELAPTGCVELGGYGHFQELARKLWERGGNSGRGV